MSLKVFNTLTGHKEEFRPLEEGKVKIYVCGVTPYNHPHIGNARPFVTWDVFRRYLEFLGYDVLHVQNFTDVDDKIINLANEENSSWQEVSSRNIDSYFAVMDKLGVKRAHIYPKVSEHMSDIVKMIKTLEDKGYAYNVDGSVYYRVEKFTDYGKLSKRNLEDMIAGARVEVDETKENPMDFALWKKAKEGEPAWDSPWGKGRPGWHIECSAMSIEYLGSSFDFHGGGSDLIFPHHENEIAQSEACSDCVPFVHYWLHNGFITLNNEKMSKSVGNFFLVKDILEHFEPEVLRFLILSTHYRSPLDFSDELMEESKRGLERLQVAKENLNKLYLMLGGGSDEDSVTLVEHVEKLKEDFIVAMNDDFNTSLAISYMFSLAKEINIYYQEVISAGKPPSGKAVEAVGNVLAFMNSIIGVLADKKTASTQEDKLSDVLNLLLDLRKKAKENKDYAQADAIRDSLAQIGIILEDTAQGVNWKIK